MEITANALQTVAINGNFLFTEVAVPGNCSMLHREGSGLVTLRGITNQCRARFRVTFGSNVALPADATVEPINVAISINGEAVAESTMISTPAAVEEFNSVSRSLFIDVPAGCCTQVGVKNIGATPVDGQNSSLIIERVA